MQFRMTIGPNEFSADFTKAYEAHLVEHVFGIWLAATRDDGPALAALTASLAASTTRLAAAVKKAGVAAHLDKDTHPHG